MEKTFIIEHLEPELYDWCIIEYKCISKIVGKKNLWFTNINKKDESKLKNLGRIFNISVRAMKLDKTCILDPESNITFNKKNSKSANYFIFGGILGDYPPKKRTRDALSIYFPNAKKFNIGKEQMSTDNAVYTVKQILSGKSLQELKFQDNVEIKINKIMSTHLPYRYNFIKGKPLMSEELIKFIKKRDKSS